MAPIAASSQSRNKLQAFNFDQENAPPANGKEVKGAKLAENNIAEASKARGSQVPQQAASSHPSSHSVAQKELKECPQTPVGRLPLAELVASGEDLNQVLDLTPIERVMWNNAARNSDQGSSQETPVLPKGKKRAYSSSPVSSSQKKNKTSDCFAGERSLDLQHLQKALKTPKGDPASDLWKKYSLKPYNDEKLSPTNAFGQPFSQLLNSSSPQTPASRLLGSDSTRLRRSFSCGTEWPTSVAKRRKLLHAGGDQQPSAALATAEGGLQKSQKLKSRLSLLVDKISGDLARPATDESDDLRASSCTSSQHDKSETSLRNPQPLGPQTKEDRDEERHIGSPVSDITITTRKQLKRGTILDGMPSQEQKRSPEIGDLSDDFGDDDLDLEMFNAIEVEETTPKLAAGFRTTDESRRDNSGSSGTGTADVRTARDIDGTVILQEMPSRAEEDRPPFKPGETQTATAVKEPRFDEFDEDANDVSVEDLEDVIAIYDEKVDLHPQQRVDSSRPQDMEASQKQSTAYGSGPEDSQTLSITKGLDTGDLVALSEEEFGGDLEFEDIIAECDKATQGHPPTSQFHASVCIRQFGSCT